MNNNQNTRPNIIVLLTDDQGFWSLGCTGNQDIHTPNIDKLATRGIRFENFFCVSPVCSAARASLLTGRIPSQHGVMDWIHKGNYDGTINGVSDHATEYLKDQNAYTDILAQNNYYCGMVGKWHLGDNLKKQKSFDDWFVRAQNGGYYYDAQFVHNGEIATYPGYTTNVMTDKAVEFIDNSVNRENPFYLTVSYNAPHSPWTSNNHPAELLELYNDCEFESCPIEPMHPDQIGTEGRGRGEKRKSLLRGYFASITGVDNSVGKIVECLEQKGILEDTVIFFTSDNGMNMGHHGIWGKGNGTFPQNMFDTSVKVPAIISRPGHIPGGIVTDQLFSHYDFMPTILDYLNIEYFDDSLPGKSFANLLKGCENDTRQDHIVVFDEYGPVRMIRNMAWKYVHRYPFGPNELYHLISDPDERNNLVHEGKYADIRGEMFAELEAWFTKYVDPEKDGARQALYGVGQIAPVSAQKEGRKAFEDQLFYVDIDGNPMDKE
jgi:choline-sulfatase